jgi:RNA polymerase sigma factor (sigma-70 family)
MQNNTTTDISANTHAAIDIQNLASQYGKCLFNFVLRRIRNEEDAKDIVQSTYIEAIRSAHNFRNESQPKTWLMGIALNLTRNQFHKNFRRNEVSLNQYQDGNDDQDSWLDSLHVNYNHPEDIVSNQETIQAVMDIFNKMSEEMRNTASMVLVDNLSYEYTAQEMNIPIGTVRSRVSRARQLLKGIQQEFNDDMAA